MSKNYLLIYSEQLATEIELTCQNIRASSIPFTKSAKVQVAFMRIFAKRTMVKAKQICFQNLKLRLKSVVKPKAGYSCCLIQIA